MNFGGHNLAHERGYMRLVHFIVLITQIPKVAGLELTTSVGEFVLILLVEIVASGEKL